MISNMGRTRVCLFSCPISRSFWWADHSMELLLSMNLHVLMLSDFLYPGIGWVEFKETYSQSLFSLLPEIQRIFYLEGTLAGPDFIEEEREALRHEATCLSESPWLSNACVHL